LTDQSTPTITSDALMTAIAFIPGFKLSSSDASFVIDAVIVTAGDTSIVTWVVVAPGFIALMVPAIWLRAESFMMTLLPVYAVTCQRRVVEGNQIFLRRASRVQFDRRYDSMTTFPAPPRPPPLPLFHGYQ
jgi:hypothetical protein